jgi:hypothetical protein
LVRRRIVLPIHRGNSPRGLRQEEVDQCCRARS